MVEKPGRLILWHIMKMYSHYGFNDFIICLGYKQEYIKAYFLNYYCLNSDITIDLEKNSTEIHLASQEKFKVTLVDTGLHTNTAGRLKRVQKYLYNETFMLTYGDGEADIDLNQLLAFHKSKQKLATLTSVQIPGKFVYIEADQEGNVLEFIEKPEDDSV